MKTKLILLLIVCGSFAYGQNYKIGSITLDSATFSKYILDCYRSPNKIKEKDIMDCWPKFTGSYIASGSEAKSIDDCEARAKEFNQKLKESSLGGEIKKKVFYPAHYDTSYCWTSFGTTRKTGPVDYIKFIPDTTKVEGTGYYLVPRKPSEDDFVKWYAKQHR